MAAPAEVVSGTVRVVKGQGFQLDGRDGWLNISRFAEPKPALPEVGAQVTAQLDGKGFVRSLEAFAVTNGTAPVAEGGKSFTPTPVASSDTSCIAPPPVRPGVTLSLRVAALQAAAVFLASRPEAKHPDVLAVAERFEEWLGR